MILYLDTSSLVKLFVDEKGSSEVRELVAQASWVATSMIASPEARSAFARQVRDRVLSARQHQVVKAAFEENWPRFLVLHFRDQLREVAGEVAETYALKALDAIHLASYLELSKTVRPVRFSSFDSQLCRALASAFGRATDRDPA